MSVGGDRNRSVLVRVPLGWTADSDMSVLANPLEKPSGYDASQKQTIESAQPMARLIFICYWLHLLWLHAGDLKWTTHCRRLMIHM